jgi:Ni,Fe-hydrogenase III small subunit
MVWKRFATHLRDGPAAEPGPVPPDATVQALSDRLAAASQAKLGRSLCLRHLDSGSCNGCELELNALSGIVYDLERFGLRFVASPRHADVLLVTGAMCRNLHEAVLRTWLATPDPKWVVAVGDCAVDFGVFKGSYGVGDSPVPFDLTIRGCPPNPGQILEGLLALLAANREVPQ